MAQYDVEVGPIQNDAAPFSPEMAAGSLPSRARTLPPPQHLGWYDGSANLNPLVQMTPEQWAGSLPSLPRLGFPNAHLGRLTSDVFYVAAAFTPDMVQGSGVRRVPVTPHQTGWFDRDGGS